MCLAIPTRIIKRQEFMATVDVGGVTRQVSLMLLPEAQVGDFVLTHAGFAIQVIDEAEAERTLALLRELAEYDR